MALPLAVDTDVVKVALGEDTDDVGELCISPSINMWAASKPASIFAPEVQVLGSGIKSHGIHRKYPSINEFHYNRPKGGDDTYYIDTFSYYNHLAGPPVQVTIVSVKNLTTDTMLSSPYVLLQGFRYRIKFTLVSGEIDPATIYEETVRTKNTDLGGGYGGITIAEAASTNVDSDDVVSSPISNKEIDILCTKSSGDPFYFFYCQYSGSEDTQYSTLEYMLEDQSFLDDFSASIVNLSISFTKIWWGAIAGQPQVAITIGNSSGINFNDLRVRYVYSSTGASGTVYDLGVDVPTTGGTSSAYMNVGSNGPGDHTYRVIAYIEMYDNVTGTWNVIKQASGSGTVTIPAG